MNKKYKSGVMLGLLVAVAILGLVYKTQDTQSPFVNSASTGLLDNEQSESNKTTILSMHKLNKVSQPVAQTKRLGDKDIAGELPTLEGINSLSGTKIHGDLRVDEMGNLIVEKSVKQLFDYFLNVAGEIPRADLIVQIKNGIADYLAEPAQSQALDLFANYLAYQEALQAEIDSGLYQVSPGNLDDLQATFQARSQLRSFYLGNEAGSAFFQEEEARDEYTLGKLRLSANTNLSEVEREAELRVLESVLPESHKKVIYKQRERETIRSKIEGLRKENASIYELQDEWNKHYDSETVERFVKLEVTRNHWNDRYNDYLDKKAAMAAEFDSEDAFQQALNQLKASLFNETELLRVNAKDRIALNSL